MSADRTTGFTDIDHQHWSLRYLPPWLRPYGRLARWDRPIGTWLLLFPCWWSVALAAAPRWGNWSAGWRCSRWARIAMRGAGCTCNDIVDRKIDARVERTRGRPLPSGEVKLRQALVWMALQSLVGVASCSSSTSSPGGVALPRCSWSALYPLMKRITSWPQVVLGLAFNWGALVGYAAVTGRSRWPTVALYAGGVSWTMGYDTIYAMQDQRDDDDRSACARRPADSATPRALAHAVRGAGGGRLGARAAISPTCGCSTSPVLLLIALHLGWQIAILKPDDQADCLAKFKANAQVGCLLTAAVVARPPRLPWRACRPIPKASSAPTPPSRAPAMVPEFRLWLASEYVPIWQATEAWLDEQNVDPPYWAFCWPGGQAIARYLLDNPESARQAGDRLRGRLGRVGAGGGAGRRCAVIGQRHRPLSLVAARLNARPTALASTSAPKTGWPDPTAPRRPTS